MKYILSFIIFLFSISVFIFGNASQKGMLITILILLAVIFIFTNYANSVRQVIKEQDALKSSISLANDKTQFINQLEKKLASFEDKNSKEYLEIYKSINILKHSQIKIEKKST